MQVTFARHVARDTVFDVHGGLSKADGFEFMVVEKVLDGLPRPTITRPVAGRGGQCAGARVVDVAARKMKEFSAERPSDHRVETFAAGSSQEEKS